MIRHFAKRTLAATFAVCVLLPAVVSAQSVSELSSELDGFASEIDTLESQVRKPKQVTSKYGLEARYNDGRIAYHLGEYQRAGSLLHSAVREPQFRSYGSYREGVYMLGDALFRVRNYIGAAEQFEVLLDNGPGEYYAEAAARLLEMAYELRDFERLEALHSRLSGSAMSGEISYLAGKAFFEQGNYERARESFAQAARAPKYRMTAEYFRGVAFVAEKNLVEAKRIFTALVNTAAPQSDDDSRVIDLSWLALGRIAYEEEDVERAIDNYSRLDRSSPYFDRSLWEQTWVLVSRGNYEEARRNVDIITYLDDPDPDILARSQLLRADLSLELGEYETARADYKAVLDRFRPIQQQMDQFAESHQDMDAFFRALVATGRTAGGTMPPLIGAWISNDPEMRAATSSLRTIQAAEDSIAEANRLFNQLAGRLGSSTRVQSFPGLAEGFAKAAKIEERLIQIRQQLVDAQFGEVGDSMSAAQKKQWSTIASELDALRQRVADVPQGREELAKREREVTAEFDRLRRRLEETGLELESQRAQLAAVENYLGEESGRPITDAERREAQKARDELKKTLVDLTESHEKLSTEVALLRESIGELDPVRQAETQLGKDYLAKLAEAEQFLDAIGGAAAQSARAKIPPVQRQLDQFFASLDQIAAQAVSGLSADVTAQRELADQHRESLQRLISTSQSGAGVLAYVNFMRARTEYTEIVLRGEVGVIDVVWKKKEDMSEKISKLFRDRTSELNLLQEAFEEVR